MKTDYLDVIQFHSLPSKETLEEHGALEALLELRDAGKVRFVGMSGTLPHLTEHIAMGVFDGFQIAYSAVEREHEAAMAAVAQQGAGIVIRGGAAKGAPTEGKQAGLQMGALAPSASRRPALRLGHRGTPSVGYSDDGAISSPLRHSFSRSR